MGIPYKCAPVGEDFKLKTSNCKLTNMHDSKLIKMLQLLKHEEWKQLERFMKSPFFNTNKRIMRFFQYLRRHHPDFKSSKLGKEKMYEWLFPTRQSYNATVMNNFMAAASRLVERFLAEMAFEAAPYAEHKMLIAAYEQRGASKLFDKQTDALITHLEGLPYRDVDIYRELFLLRYNKVNQPHVNRYQLMHKDFEVMDSTLNMYFMTEKLRLGAEVQAHGRISLLRNRKYGY